MLETRIEAKSPARSRRISAGDAPELNADRLFASDLATTRVLRREEEEELAHSIRRARDTISELLAAAPQVVRLALEPLGHRVVWPDEDFREREAVLVLRHAQFLLSERKRRADEFGMTRIELRRWAAGLRTALTDYRVLRDRMVRANVRLVNMLARRYPASVMGHLDLVQEGVLGLMRAIEKYEPSRNVRFSTYATWWIWQALGRSNDTLGALIRTPVHWGQMRRRIGRGHPDLTDETGAPLSRQEMAEAQGMNAARFEAMTRSYSFVSTDAPLREGDDRPLDATLASPDIGPAEEVESAALRGLLERALTELPEREQFILRHRFGLEDDQTRSLEELGKELGVSRERVRQLEARALTKLKRGIASDALASYLN